MTLKKTYRNIQQEFITPFLIRKKRKFFCIGRNKTGTTSLRKAMSDLGYTIGNQRKAEKLISFYKIRDFRPIIEYCRSAEFFQDVPFSWPFTFIAMDLAFPQSKFILTVRDNAEQWYNSLVKFHSTRFALNGLPKKEDLLNDTYCYKGWAWEVNKLIYETPDDDPYQKDILINHYEAYNLLVLNYFKYKPKNFLLLNPGDADSYIKLCEFLEKKPLYEKMPWENKS
jgi:hypothetical protein